MCVARFCGALCVEIPIKIPPLKYQAGAEKKQKDGLQNYPRAEASSPAGARRRRRRSQRRSLSGGEHDAPRRLDLEDGRRRREAPSRRIVRRLSAEEKRWLFYGGPESRTGKAHLTDREIAADGVSVAIYKP